MTEPDGLPRVCDPCRWEFHEHCRAADWCECTVTYCYERVLEEL